MDPAPTAHVCSGHQSSRFRGGASKKEKRSILSIKQTMLNMDLKFQINPEEGAVRTAVSAVTSLKLTEER